MVRMPEFEGLSLPEMIRDRPQWRSIPVVVMSGEADDALAERAWQLGVKAYLVKSQFFVPELLASVKQYTQYRPN